MPRWLALLTAMFSACSQGACTQPCHGTMPSQGCVQPRCAQAENIAVNSASHLGMGTHPTVLNVLIDRLAQPEGRWRPYAG